MLPSTNGRPLAADLNRPGVRIALLLPLQSGALAQPAEAVRAGFMAGYERDRNGVSVNVIPTGDSSQATLDAYARAAEQHDIVVGPWPAPPWPHWPPAAPSPNRPSP